MQKLLVAGPTPKLRALENKPNISRYTVSYDALNISLYIILLRYEVYQR